MILGAHWQMIEIKTTETQNGELLLSAGNETRVSVMTRQFRGHKQSPLLKIDS